MKPSSMILSMAAAGSAANHAQAFVSSPSFSSAHATARRSTPPGPPFPRNPVHSSSAFQMVATASPPDMKEETYAMRIGDIRRELESYGVSTESIFEKGELVEALMKARREERIPVEDWDREDAASTSREESGGDDGSGPVDGDGATAKNGWFRSMVDRFAGEASRGGDASTRNERVERYKKECKKLKVKELKEELESYGLPTSYFEKSEFERAVAEARVDGAKKATTSAARDGAGSARAHEPWDPSYRDVAVTKFDADFLDGIVIDV